METKIIDLLDKAYESIELGLYEVEYEELEKKVAEGLEHILEAQRILKKR